MTQDPLRTIPKRRSGVRHLIDAAGYSFAGLQRLSREAAVRIELCATLAGLTLLILAGVTLGPILIFLGLCILMLVVEALNTALEELVDLVSPDWSQAAKHAKDLASAAVALVSLLPAGYLVFCLL